LVLAALLEDFGGAGVGVGSSFGSGAAEAGVLADALLALSRVARAGVAGSGVGMEVGGALEAPLLELSRVVVREGSGVGAGVLEGAAFDDPLAALSRVLTRTGVGGSGVGARAGSGLDLADFGCAAGDGPL
jgi:hypothetical protein